MKTLLTRDVKVSVDAIQLDGILSIPPNARGIVLTAQASSQNRNKLLTSFFHDEQIATLAFDLLTDEEKKEDSLTRELRFNIPLLTHRLIGALNWLKEVPEVKNLSVGFLGMGTGSAAAFLAASELGTRINAIVSKGGRPDLAGQALHQVQTPTLLIVGGADFGVIELNQKAFELLVCEKQLEVVEGATHFFEEPGTLEEAGRMAAHFFSLHL